MESDEPVGVAVLTGLGAADMLCTENETSVAVPL